MRVRKIITIIILICISLQTFKYANAKVATTFTINSFDYTITKAATKTAYGTVSMKANTKSINNSNTIKIPEKVKYNGCTYQVTCIGKSAFSGWTSLKNVTIPKSITTIEAYAFRSCQQLMRVDIPDNINRININAFYDCSSELTLYCYYESCAYYFVKNNDIKYKIITDPNSSDGNEIKKLILVGDSRTNNMNKWVKTSVPTEFVAKSQMGFRWFEEDAIDHVNAIKNKGDVIVIWLGVNDYNSVSLGGDTWTVYANKINSLANNEWSDCKVYVAAVGYVDRAKQYAYYGKDIRSNVTQLSYGNQIYGIAEFNNKLKEALNDKTTWLDTYDVIGIQSDDITVTSDNIWYTRANGLKDGLHYSKSKTQEIYNYFVNQTMSK